MRFVKEQHLSRTSAVVLRILNNFGPGTFPQQGGKFDDFSYYLQMAPSYFF